MPWFFRKPLPPDKIPVLRTEIPRDDDRAGPVPPPPPSATPPGVTVQEFDAVPAQSLLRLGSGLTGFFLEGEGSALLILTGGAGSSASAAAGDVLIWAAAPRERQGYSAEQVPFTFEELCRRSPGPPHHIRRDDLAGKGISGITGIRTLAKTAELAVVRLGPPPGARWVLVGLRSFAVFAGRITAIDGGESRDVNAGELAVIADPSATLYLQAGNDSALAIGFARPDLVVALG